MIPAREKLEQLKAGIGREQEAGYTKEELDHLDDIRAMLEQVPDEERAIYGRLLVSELWPSSIDRIRKTHLIATKQVGEVVLFKPNHVQRKLWREVIEPGQAAGLPVRIVNLKARQLGMSTFYQSLMYEWCASDGARRSLTVSYSVDSTVELMQKSHQVRRNLWWPHPVRKMRGNNLGFENDSSLHAKTAGVDSVGRGDTYHYLHLSEIPMWPDAGEAFTSVMQSCPSQPGTFVAIESTARGAVGEFYETWRKAERGESEFTPFFAPWFWDAEYRRELPSADFRRRFERSLNIEERRLRERFQLDLEQLLWRRWCIANNCQGSEAKFRQEYPSSADEAFLTTGSPCFDAYAVARLADNARPPVWTGEVNLIQDKGKEKSFETMSTPAGHLHVWDEPADGRAYVIGADVAEGRVRDKTLSARRKLHSYSDEKPDYSSASVIELDTGLHVATWHGHINPYDYALTLFALGLMYNQAMLVVEVNGPGIATITALAEQLAYPNLFRSRQYAVMAQHNISDQYGWRTLPQTREQLIFRITEAISQDSLWTRDGRTIDEIRTMERDHNGNPRALGTNKDDRVFSLALALQGRYDIFGGRQEAQEPKTIQRREDAEAWAHYERRSRRKDGSRTRRPGGRRDVGPRGL